MQKHLMIFSGSANQILADSVCKYLNIQLGKLQLSRFSDGEIAVEVLDNVRGADVFIIQPTSFPTNDNLVELLLLIDALKRASAWRITAAITYFGYARQDRRARSIRVPISAKVVANMITSAGADRVLTVDLHAEQIQGFFDIAVDNIYASPVLIDDIKKLNYKDMIILSPDIGGVMRARAFAKLLGVELAIIDKRRPRANETEVMNIIGDVKNKTCILIDDIIDTASTICTAATALKASGALNVYAYATHGVLSGNAIANIKNSEIDEIVLTDTISLNAVDSKIRVISIDKLFAETIKRISNEESISALFNQ